VMPDSGQKLTPHNVLVEVRKGKASAEIARALAVKAGSPIHVIKRILEFQGRPIIMDEMVLAASRFPGLTVPKLEEYKGSMYSFYEAVYGLRMIRAEERIRAVAAVEPVASQLRVPAGTPLLCVDRIAFTYGDMPVEWRRGLCLTDGFSYFNELA